MKRAWNRVALLTPLGVAAWLYFPPIGHEVELPHLEPFLEPRVPHGRPTFIDTGEHIYYRVRLERLVGWDFTGDYLDHLPEAGVQLAAYATSPHVGVRVNGWEMAMVREKALTPYTIEYWKSNDLHARALPAFLRWPWLYVRLARDVLQGPRVVVLTPGRDLVAVPEAFPRLPGALARHIERTDRALTVAFVADSDTFTILDYYSEIAGKLKGCGLLKRARDVQCQFDPVDIADMHGATWLHAEVSPALIVDHPLYIYAREYLSSVPGPNERQALGTLSHLPRRALGFVVSIGRP
jgi:hypothetical protein